MKILSTLLLSLLLFQANAQSDPKQAVGDWEGSINLPDGRSLQVIFHLSAEGESLSATMDSPAQNAYGLKMDKAEFKDDVITMTMNQIQGSYKGTLKGGKFEGTWSQSGQSFPLNLEKVKK